MILSPVDILIKNRHLDSEAAFEAYGDALNALRRAPKDPALLPRLITVFCDVEDYEVLWTLLHYVESFPREEYVPALIDATPRLLDGQEWLRRLYLRILNSDTYRPYLKALLREASTPQQRAVRTILEQIPAYTGEHYREDFTQKVAFVLSPE